MAKKINHRQIKGRRNLIKLMQASGVFLQPKKKKNADSNDLG